MATRKNTGKARELCLNIEHLLNAYKVHGQQFDKYTADDKQKMETVKQFFGIKENFDLIVLSLFVDNKLLGGDGLNTKKLSKSMRLSMVQGIDLEASLERLKNKRIISMQGRHFEPDYRLTEVANQAVLNYDRSGFKTAKKLKFADFITELNETLLVMDDILSGDISAVEVSELMERYSSTNEMKWIYRKVKDRNNRIVLCLALREYMMLGNYLDVTDAINLIVKNKFDFHAMQKEFITGNNALIRNGILTYANEHYVGKMLRLTDSTIEALCAGVTVESRAYVPNMFSMVNATQIKEEVYLHQNKDLELMEKILSPAIYDKVKVKVPRLTFLLTGEPGVGKTSFINHLARKTGRVILSTNIATVLSSFVGGSEKNIVKLFREAAEANQKLDIAPIIVFDEAESLLYNRSAKANRAVDQMTNNVISLLLSELDRFKGILICCSNFSFAKESFDTALHRRFYMVSEVKAPSTDVLKNIFKYHFPNATDVDIDRFLLEFPFVTPAQIRNLRDKYEIERLIIEDFEDNFTPIERIARNDLEIFIRRQNRAVGFKQ